jgi:hypothetical protein
MKGWNWLVCVRFQDRGHQRTYVFFVEKEEIIDSRYSIQTDQCSDQIYSPFNQMVAPMGPQGPLY